MSKPTPKVADYMTENPHSIGLRQTLAQAYALMREHNVRHLPVLSGGKLVGLLADPDLHTVDLLTRFPINEIAVEQAMTPVPYAVTADTRLDVAAREMAAHKYDAVVVMRDARVVGVFTAIDALRALAATLGGGGTRA